MHHLVVTLEKIYLWSEFLNAKFINLQNILHYNPFFLESTKTVHTTKLYIAHICSHIYTHNPIIYANKYVYCFVATATMHCRYICLLFYLSLDTDLYLQ